MSLEFLTRRERIVARSYMRVFDRTDVPGAGYSFDCDADGYIALSSMNPAARENLERCLTGQEPVIDMGIETWEHAYWNAASVRCDCGNTIWLDDPMYNTCDRCGLDCNGSGQRLAPVSQWEPEDRYDVFGPR